MLHVPRRRHATPRWAPEPPIELPEGRVVELPGRGEVFIRDSGGGGRPVLLLHGWMFSADLNWFRQYDPLREAGYRVLALDHRGHGRGLRTYAPFRLEECAGDAAALLRELDTGPAIVAGYSMGGPIAQLVARDHPDVISGLVLCATAQEWREPRMRALWNAMAAVRLLLGLAPYKSWRRALRSFGFPDSAATTWVTAELTRGSARDMAEAGRELGRFDSREWLRELTVPSAVVLTTLDRSVPARKQRDLATALDAPTFEVPGDHGVVVAGAREFNPALLAALEAVGAAGG